MKHEEYYKPLLATIYYVLGCVVMVGTLVVTVNQATLPDDAESSMPPLLVAFVGGFGALIPRDQGVITDPIPAGIAATSRSLERSARAR